MAGQAFTYRVKSSSEHEVCAAFLTDSHGAQTLDTLRVWQHPKGEYCYSFDASKPVQQAPYLRPSF